MKTGYNNISDFFSTIEIPNFFDIFDKKNNELEAIDMKTADQHLREIQQYEPNKFNNRNNNPRSKTVIDDYLDRVPEDSPNKDFEFDFDSPERYPTQNQPIQSFPTNNSTESMTNNTRTSAALKH